MNTLQLLERTMGIVVSPAAKQEPKIPEPPKKPSKAFPGEKERWRKMMLDRLILAATFSFCGLMIFTVWYSQGRVLDKPIRFLSQFAGKDALAPRNAAQNCANPKNKNTPYCQEREGQVQADWQSMSRNQDGETNPFTLHGR